MEPASTFTVDQKKYSFEEFIDGLHRGGEGDCHRDDVLHADLVIARMGADKVLVLGLDTLLQFKEGPYCQKYRMLEITLGRDTAVTELKDLCGAVQAFRGRNEFDQEDFSGAKRVAARLGSKPLDLYVVTIEYIAACGKHSSLDRRQDVSLEGALMRALRANDELDPMRYLAAVTANLYSNLSEAEVDALTDDEQAFADAAMLIEYGDEHEDSAEEGGAE